MKQNILYSDITNSESRRQESYISNQFTLTSNLKAIQWQIISFDKLLKAIWYFDGRLKLIGNMFYLIKFADS